MRKNTKTKTKILKDTTSGWICTNYDGNFTFKKSQLFFTTKDTFFNSISYFYSFFSINRVEFNLVDNKI